MGTKLKNISYSTWVKTTAFLLTIISFAAAFSFLAHMVVSTKGVNELFEKDYISSSHAVGEIQSIYNSIEGIFALKSEDYIVNELGGNQYNKQVEDKLKKLESAQNYLSTMQGIYYYVSDGVNTFTNCDMTTAYEFKRFGLYNITNAYSEESSMSFYVDSYIPRERNMKVFIAVEDYAAEQADDMYINLSTLVSLKNEEYIKNFCLNEMKKQIQNNLQQFAIHQSSLKNLKGIYYYATDGENILANCDMTTVDEFKSFNYYNITNGYLEDLTIGSNSHISLTADKNIFIAIEDNFVLQNQAEFKQTKATLQKKVRNIIMLFIIGLLTLVYLIFVCGRDRNKNINMLTVDRLWTEFSIGVVLAAMIGFAIVIEAMVRKSGGTIYINFLPIVMVVTAIFCAIGLMFLLSVVRHIKNRTLIRHSFIYIICKKIGGMLKAIFDITPLTAKVIGTVIAAEIIAVITIVTLFASNSFFLFFFLLISGTAGILFLIIKYVLKPYDDEVKTRLELSLNREMKAERLKTDLITNVSHDLKTPLTAIINYSDLLVKEDNGNEYAKIIYEKSQKLKTLTEDLFEVSKAQSGNIAANMETLNISELINQTLAEFDEYTVEFKLNVQDINIFADGRLMSRVFENLVGNIIKYSLPNTRAYIDAFQKESKIYIVFKNIANYEMNFESGEMTERFSRGDTARTTDGNGLGLAIAQSYIQACGGKLLIDTDGDLFKATAIFNVLDKKEYRNG